VNVPIGIAALFVTAAFLLHTIKRVAHKIDYSGFVTLVVAASSLVIYTSLGGSSFGWFSGEGILLLTVGLASTAAFIFTEFRAQEPILMPRLFRNRVFTSGSAISFVVGFAMFGALLFLPLFMQEVNGVSPTMSGLRILPLMGGLLTASITAGNLVSRGRKYRPFPIAGTAIMCVGLGLLGTISVTSSALMMGVYMCILGIGIGLVMQILVTAVQNAVDYKDLGVATAGANFFRSIGGCFGTAIFGALFANVWPHNLVAQAKHYGVKNLNINPAALQSISRNDLLKLGPQAFEAITHALASSVKDVFLWALPVGVIALLLSLTLPEVKLRSSFHEVPESLEPIPDMIG
jgi:MFS family permease